MGNIFFVETLLPSSTATESRFSLAWEIYDHRSNSKLLLIRLWGFFTPLLHSLLRFLVFGKPQIKKNFRMFFLWKIVKQKKYEKHGNVGFAKCFLQHFSLHLVLPPLVKRKKRQAFCTRMRKQTFLSSSPFTELPSWLEAPATKYDY